MEKPKFKFVDLPKAAELLNLPRTEVLAMVKAGRLRPKTGEGQSAIFLTADVFKLAEELGAASPNSEAEPEMSSEVTEGKTKRKIDPLKRVGARMAAEKKWLDVSEADMREWVAAQPPISYAAIRKEINRVEDKLKYLLFLLNSSEPDK